MGGEDSVAPSGDKLFLGWAAPGMRQDLFSQLASYYAFWRVAESGSPRLGGFRRASVTPDESALTMGLLIVKFDKWSFYRFLFITFACMMGTLVGANM